MNKFRLKQIGIIHSPYKEPKGTPIQPVSGEAVEGEVEVFRKYRKGLKDLDGFSHVILIYFFHLILKSQLRVIPYMDKRSHGVFSTRAPGRPNPIGISVVELLDIDKNILRVRDLDIVDGTPLLDIKPYVPDFDRRPDAKIGWLENHIQNLRYTKDDERFID